MININVTGNGNSVVSGNGSVRNEETKQVIDDEKTVLYAIYMYYLILGGDKFRGQVHALISLDLRFFTAFLHLQTLGYLVGCVPTQKALDEVSEKFELASEKYGYEKVRKMMNIFSIFDETFLFSLGAAALQIQAYEAQLL